MRKIFALAFFAILIVSCDKTQPVVELPKAVSVYGEGTEYGAEGCAMVQVAEGVWDIYSEFTSGKEVTVKADGEVMSSFAVTPAKGGLGLLRVNTATKEAAIVHINKVSLVVIEGGVDNPKHGNEAPIEAVYKGKGVWTVGKLFIPTDHVRYRYQLDTDTPSQLKYWCATWDNAGSAPKGLDETYLKVRALGEKDYKALYLKDNRACWMFPQDKTLMLSDFTISMNAGPSVQSVVFSSPHIGPRAAFMGDSITWQWGTTPNNKAKSEVEQYFHLDPCPSWMQINGDVVRVTWRPQFFTENDYIDVGISGNNTTQMLARFDDDVIKPDPHCVVIMGGTNDLAQGQTKAKILENITAMCDKADKEGIKVILCSITPCNRVYGNLSNPNTKGAHIIAVNEMVKSLAASRGYPYCDYFPCLVDEDGLSMLKKYWLYDDLHPNPDAYVEMEKVIKPIIDKLLDGE